MNRWPLLVVFALLGFVLALFGTYWDDAWHTEEGRDTFFIAPHLVLYAGISLTGGALAAWAALMAREIGVRQALRHPPLLLSVTGVALTLAAAPIDNGWHVAFGRDSVIWSPPHMLGVAGSALIASALLLELGSTARRPLELTAAIVAGAAVVGVTATPVLEYETDVPQFDVAFYLPVLTAGVAFAFGLARLALPTRFAATWSALFYTAVMGGVALVLLAGDRVAPLLPLLVAPALAFDLTRAASFFIRAGALTTVIFVTYVPYLNWVRSDVFLEAGDIAVGVPLALLGAAVGLALTADGSPPESRPRIGRALGTALVLALMLPARVLGHDPGQGEELTTASIAAQVEDDRAAITVSPASHCDDLEAGGLTARRAGQTVVAKLAMRGSCTLVGSVPLPERGRWFVYAELRHEGEAVETWLPVEAGGFGSVSDEDRSVYFPPEVSDPPIKLAAGVVVYALLAGVLFLISLSYRRFRPMHDGRRAAESPTSCRMKPP
ncbi:MAG: hypothetical protein M3355_06335 [Actinomycetota bacterium]|nr:hypothetical protein [Actinomycetota bacterium]